LTRGLDRPDSPKGSQKLLSRVTGGFDSRDSPWESETAVTGDAWIRHPTHPLVSQKLLSRETRGFDRPDSPLGSQKLLSPVTRGFDSQTAP